MKILTAALMIALSIPAVSKAGLIADLGEDYCDNAPACSSGIVPTGWEYEWNPTGVDLGDSTSYAVLGFNATAGDFLVGAVDPSDDFTNSNGGSTAETGYVWNGGFTTDWILGGADPTQATDGKAHYAIFTYTVQPGEQGVGATASFDGSSNSGGVGAEVILLVNDVVVLTQSGAGASALDFEQGIGSLNAGDEISLAVRGLDSTASRNNQRVFLGSYQISVVPEPSSLLVMSASSLLWCMVLRRR